LEPANDQAVSLLRDALTEAQATVRSYDTKAQIVGVGYILALNVVGRISDMLPNAFEVTSATVLISWGIVILPILLFGHVLYPTRRTVPELTNESTEHLKKVLYTTPKDYERVDGLRQAAEQCDLIDEYAFELLKVSNLRELKRKRFIRALSFAAIAFVFLFAIQYLQTR